MSGSQLYPCIVGRQFLPSCIYNFLSPILAIPYVSPYEYLILTENK